jgi:hypothetical protein
MKPFFLITLLFSFLCVQAQVEISGPSIGLKLPAGISLEQTNSNDSVKVLSTYIILPKTSLKELQDPFTLLYSILEKEKLKFIETIDPDPRMRKAASGNYFSIRPIELYKDDKIISFLFEISFAHAGAAHPRSEYYTFNYHLQKQKPLLFADYFNVETDKDKEALVQLMNSEFNDENIKVNSFYEFDFNITENAVTFNFDNYEITSYAMGMPRIEINKKLIRNFVMSEYLKL